MQMAVFRCKAPITSLGLADVARHSQSKDPVGLSESAEFKPSAVAFPNGCHMVEVEIDPQTGVVKIDARLCLGIRHIEMSATPARVWAVIQGAKLAVPRPKSMSNASRIRSSELRPIATAALVPLLVAHGALYGVDVGTAKGALPQWRTAQVCLEQVDRANTRWRPSASQRLHPRRAVRPIAQTSARSGSLAKPPPSRSHAWSLTVIDGCMRLCDPLSPSAWLPEFSVVSNTSAAARAEQHRTNSYPPPPRARAMLRARVTASLAIAEQRPV